MMARLVKLSQADGLKNCSLCLPLSQVCAERKTTNDIFRTAAIWAVVLSLVCLPYQASAQDDEDEDENAAAEQEEADRATELGRALGDMIVNTQRANNGRSAPPSTANNKPSYREPTPLYRPQPQYNPPQQGARQDYVTKPQPVTQYPSAPHQGSNTLQQRTEQDYSYCISHRGESIEQSTQRGVYEHHVLLANSCSQPLDVRLCYRGTNDCILPDVGPGRTWNSTLGIKRGISHFEYQIDWVHLTRR